MLLGGVLAFVESHWVSLVGRLGATWLYLGGPGRQKVTQSCTKGDEADTARTLKTVVFLRLLRVRVVQVGIKTVSWTLLEATWRQLGEFVGLRGSLRHFLEHLGDHGWP